MSEQAKAERRVVIANNKAWDSARSVRARWLTTFLTRRTAPKDAPQWIAATLASCAHEVRRAMEDGHGTALTLLGLQGEPAWRPYGGAPNPAAQAAGTSSPARATVIALGLLLGGLEAGMDRDTWRRPSPTDRAYLLALQGWGYPLSEVEQLVVAVEPEPEPPAGDESGDEGSRPEPGEPGEPPVQPDATEAPTGTAAAADDDDDDDDSVPTPAGSHEAA